MMRSASRRAQDELSAKEDEVFGGASTKTLAELSGQLYSAAQLLVGQPRLRRTLGDPATSPQARAGLAEQLFGGKIDAQALDLVTAAVEQRWSSPWDLTDSLEGIADDALFAAAEKDGALDSVEDELFRFERILDGDSEAGSLMDEASVAAERRLTLLDSLVKDKVGPLTLELLHHALISQRKRSITLAIDDLLEKAAARRHRSVARVTSAVALTDEQRDRLAAILTQMYGREISVRTALDPAVRGGLVVRVGDEVIDGSVATRLAQARNTIAG